MMMRRLYGEPFYRGPDHRQDPSQRVSIVRGQRRGDDDAEFEPLATFFQLDPLTLVLTVVDVANLDAPRKDLPVVPVVLTGYLESTTDDEFDPDGTCHPGFIHDDLELTVEHGILLRLRDLVDDPFAQDLELGLWRMDEDDRLGDV